MNYIAALLVLFSSQTWATQCLTYRDEITLSGLLLRQTFPEQPNYESIKKGDAAATYFFLKLAEPVCMAAGQVQNNESAETQVKIMQLAFSTGEEYSKLRPYLGKVVECRGSLFHAISGHHHSRVLLLGAKCQP